MLGIRCRKETDVEAKFSFLLTMNKRDVDHMVNTAVPNPERKDKRLDGEWNLKFQEGLGGIDETGIEPGSIKLAKINSRINSDPSKSSDFFTARCQCASAGCPAFYRFRMKADYRKDVVPGSLLNFESTRFHDHIHDPMKPRRIRREDRQEIVDTVIFLIKFNLLIGD